MQQTFPCPKCGCQNYIGQPFCRNCGNRLSGQSQQQPYEQQQMYSCPRCGQPVVYGTAFCGNCQTPFSWPTQQQVQPPPVYQQQQQAYYANRGEEPKQKKTSPWLIALIVLIIIVPLAGGSFFAINSGSFSIPFLQTPEAAAKYFMNSMINQQWEQVWNMLHPDLQASHFNNDMAYFISSSESDPETWVDFEVGKATITRGSDYDTARVPVVTSGANAFGIIMKLSDTLTLRRFQGIWRVCLLDTPAITSPANRPPVSGPKGKISISYSSSTATSLGQYFEAQSGHTFLVLKLTINNKSADSFIASSFHFAIVIDNIQYDCAVYTFKLNDALKRVTVLANGTAIGSIAYEIPLGLASKAYEVKYTSFSANNYDITYIKE